MKKIQMLVVCFLLASLVAQAQVQKELSFSETTYDFGQVNEDGGPVEHEFVFTNNANKPITIKNVQASCGCTTPGWSKDPVPPGKTGYIKALYNPKNRPGPFNKSLTITTDAEEATTRLYIKGSVSPGAKSVEETLTTAMGGLRVQFNALNMGKVVATDKPTTKKFDVFNASDKPIAFLLDKTKAPAHIKVAAEPSVLQPNASGSLVLAYDAKAKNDLGFMNESVVLYTDEPQASEKSFSVYATIVEYFPPMTKEELAKAPSLSLASTVHDFGKVKQNTVVSAVFTVTNVGKSPLNIRKAKPNCACTTAMVDQNTIAPGGQAKIKVDFDAKGRRGNQQKSVAIYSNDPKAPVQRLTIKAVVEAMPQ